MQKKTLLQQAKEQIKDMKEHHPFKGNDKFMEVMNKMETEQTNEVEVDGEKYIEVREVPIDMEIGWFNTELLPDMDMGTFDIGL